MDIMRLDKYISKSLGLSRKEAKAKIIAGLIKVNDNIIKDPSYKIKEADKIYFLDREIIYKDKIYIILNKPKFFVSSKVNEGKYKSVYELIDHPMKKELSIAGRLDADAEGLLILTNDGELIHKIISPKKKIWKTYQISLLKELDDNSINLLEKGLKIGDYTTLPAKLNLLSRKEVQMKIMEGKYHQIKLMFEAVGNKVMKLKRIAIGGLILPKDLEEGKWKELNEEEIKQKIFEEDYL